MAAPVLDLPEEAIREGLRALEDMLADGASWDTAFRMGLGVALSVARKCECGREKYTVSLCSACDNDE